MDNLATMPVVDEMLQRSAYGNVKDGLAMAEPYIIIRQQYAKKLLQFGNTDSEACNHLRELIEIVNKSIKQLLIL